MFALNSPGLATPQQPAVPTGGIPVVGPEGLVGPASSPYGTAEQVTVTGQPFTRAVRIATTKVPPNEWEFEVAADATVAVHQGDVMLATMYVRAIKGQPETGEGRTTMDFQRKGGEWTKMVSQPIAITKQWRKVYVPFTASLDTAPGAANVAFRLGYGVQTVEIGGFSLVNYGKTVALKDLPRTAIHYRGEEANAPWRLAALKRIEQIRKAPLQIRVVDAKGLPVAGASVDVVQTRQSFAFGTAVDAGSLFGQDANGERYRREIVSHFNRATIENHLKWPMWQTTEFRETGLKAVDWLRKMGLTIRGHNLVWPSWRNSPEGLQALSPAELRKRVEDHIDDEATAMRGKAEVWDVVNEPYDNHDILDRLGNDPIPGWFRRVRAIDPKPVLCLNDYPPLDGAALTNPHLNDFYRRLQGLKAAGVPLGMIGFQCHVGGDPISPNRLLSGLDRFAKLGLPIEITEFDINSQDRAYQARYMKDFLLAMYSHPAVVGFTQWGFTALHHWLPDSALYDTNWELRPHGRTYFDMVDRTWRTRAKGRTAANGRYQVRGFLGDYAVAVSTPGRTPKKMTVRLTKGTGAVTVVLK